jgi:succinoglycan biosynthesis transport protein ExoP
VKHRAFQPHSASLESSTSGNDIILDFSKIFEILRRGWWIITGAGFAGAVIAAFLVLQVEPTYSAKAQLLIGQNSRSDGGLGALLQDLNLDDDAIASEIAILTSGRILSKISARLNLASRPEFNAALRPPEPDAILPVRLADQAVDMLKKFIGVDLEANLSDSSTESGVQPDPIATAARIGKRALGAEANFVGELRTSLRVRQVGNTSLVDVSFSSTDRLLAAAIPNAAVNVYLEDQLNRKFDGIQRVTQGLQPRLADMRERLEISERAVIDYRNQNLTEGFGSQSRLNQQIDDLSRRLGQLTAEQTELISDLNGIDGLIQTNGLVAAAGLFESDLIENTQSQIAELRQRQDLLLERFSGETSLVRDVDNEIVRLETTLSDETQRMRDNQAQRAELSNSRVVALRQQLSTLEVRAIEQAEREVQLTQLQRDYAAEQAVYATFLDKFTETSEALNLQEGDVLIISYADPPPSPVAPDKKLAVALGGIGGGFLGIALLFVWSLTDNKVRDVSQLRVLTTGGVFTQMRTRGLLLRNTSPLTVAKENPLGPLSESVRSLRSHLMLSIAKERIGGTVVSIVSTRTDCGKTTTSMLLARSLAQMGVACVVVDTDLRRGSISTVLNLPARPDLTDVLMGSISLETAIQKDPGSAARIITARSGLHDPAGFLLSEAMTNLLQQLRDKFQVVIIDTAPLNSVSDAAPVIRMSHNVVMMVRYGIPLEEVNAGFNSLFNLGAAQVSAVLSMAPRGSEKMYDYNA